MLCNDTRAYVECAEIEASEPEAPAISGNLMMPGFTAPKLLWMRKREPVVFERVRKVVLPKDYVGLCLSGETVCDMSDASGTGWLDVADRDWSDRLLAATHLTRSHMPRLVEGTECAAQLREALRREWGISHTVWIAGGAAIDVHGGHTKRWSCATLRYPLGGATRRCTGGSRSDPGRERAREPRA